MAEKPRITAVSALVLLLPLAVAFAQTQDDYIVRSTVNDNGDYLYVRIPPENDNGFDLVLRRAGGSETTILRCANTSSSPITFTSTVPPGRQRTGYLEGFGRYFSLNDNGLAAVRIAITNTQNGSDREDDPNDPNDPYGFQAIVTVTSAGVVKTIVLDGDTIAGEAVGASPNEGLTPWPGLNNSGQVAFGEREINYSGPKGSDDSGYRIIRYNPGPPATYDVLLRRGDSIFGTFFVLNDGSDDNSVNTLNSAAQVLTRAQLTDNMGAPTMSLDSLLILNGPGNLTEVKREGQTDALAEVEMGVLNDGGQALYKSSDTVTNCVSPAIPHEHLVRFTPPSTYTLIAVSGADVPGTAGGGPAISGFGAKYQMNNLGHVAFVAGIELDPTNPSQSPSGPDYCPYPRACAQDQILFFWNGSTLTPIARTTTLDGTDCAGIASGLGGFDFDWFANFVHLNDNDTVVFFAERGTCRSPYGAEFSGWFSWSPTGGLNKIIAEGDTVAGGQVTNLDPKPGQDGQKMLSDTGDFAVSAAIDGPAPGGTTYPNGYPDDEDIPVTFIAATTQQQAATQVPALGTWAAALLALLLAGLGVMQARRRLAAA